MSLAEIQIEQITAGGWVARVEVGGMVAKRRTVSASSIGAVIAGMIEAYAEIAPAEALVAADLGAVRAALDALVPAPTDDDSPEPDHPPTVRARTSLPPLRDAMGAKP